MAARHAAPTSSRVPARREWARGVGALLVLLMLVVGIPAVLIAVTGVPFTHGLPSAPRLWGRLRQPDDGQLLLDALLIVAWAGWAAFTAAVTAETVALARGSVAPALVGLGVLQPVAGRLLASIALLLPASTVLQLAAGAGHPLPATAPLHPTSRAAIRPVTGAVTPTGCPRGGLRDGSGNGRGADAGRDGRCAAAGLCRRHRCDRPTRHVVVDRRTPPRQPVALARHRPTQRRTPPSRRQRIHRPQPDPTRLDVATTCRRHRPTPTRRPAAGRNSPSSGSPADAVGAHNSASQPSLVATGTGPDHRATRPHTRHPQPGPLRAGASSRGCPKPFGRGRSAGTRPLI